MTNPWKTKSSKIVYETSWMKIREDEVTRPNGKDGVYSFVETPQSVYIVAVNENSEVYLVGQWRYPTKIYSWELPGGSSDGLDLLEAAKKELREETGLEAQSWTEVGTFQPMNGISSEISHVFLARELTKARLDKQNEEGIDNMQTVSFEQFFEMIRAGEISDAQSITAFTHAKLFLETKDL